MKVIWTFKYKAHIPKPLTDIGRTTFTPLRSQRIGTHLRFVTMTRGIVRTPTTSVPGTFTFEFEAVFPSVIHNTQYLPLLKETLKREDFHIPPDVTVFFPVRGVSWYSWGWFLKGIHNLSDDLKGILVGTHNVYDDDNDPLRHSNLFVNPQGNAFYEDVRSYFYTGNPSDPRVVNPVLVPRRLFDNLRLYIRFFDTVYIFKPTEYARRRYYRLVEEEFIPIMNVLQGLSWLEPHPIKDDEELQELIGVPTERCAVFWSFGLGEALYTALFPETEGTEILPYPTFRPPTLNTYFLRDWMNSAYNITYRPSRYSESYPVTDWEVIDGPGWASWSWNVPLYSEEDERKFDEEVKRTGGDWAVTYADFSTAYMTSWGTIEAPAVITVPTPILFWTSTTGNFIVLGLETEDLEGENIPVVLYETPYRYVGRVSLMKAYLVARAHIGITPTKRLKETTILYRPPNPKFMNQAFSPWLELEEVFVIPYGGKVKPRYKMKPREHFKVLDYMTTPDRVTTSEGVEITPENVVFTWAVLPTGDSSNVHFAPEREGLWIDGFNDAISFKLPIWEMGRSYRDFVDRNLRPLIEKCIEEIKRELTDRRYLHRRLSHNEMTGWQYGVVDQKPSPNFIIDMTTEKVPVTLKTFWTIVGNPPIKLYEYEEREEYDFPMVKEKEVPGTKVLKVMMSEIPPPFLYSFPSLPIDLRKLEDKSLSRSPRVVAFNAAKVTPPEIQVIHTLWIDDSFPASFVVWKPDEEKGKVKWMFLVDPSAWDNLPVDDLIQILSTTKIWNAYRCDKSEWIEAGYREKFGFFQPQLQRYNQPLLVAVRSKSIWEESFSEGMNDLEWNKFVIVRSFSGGQSVRLEFQNPHQSFYKIAGALKDYTKLPFVLDLDETLKCISYRLGVTDDDVFDNRKGDVRRVVLPNPKGNVYPSAGSPTGYTVDKEGNVRLIERGEIVSPKVIKTNQGKVSPAEFLPFVRLISLFYSFRRNLKVFVSSSGEISVTTKEDFIDDWLNGKSLGLVYPPNVLGVPLSVPIVDWSSLNSPTITVNERLLYLRTEERGIFDGGVSLQQKRVTEDYDFRIFTYPVTDYLQMTLFFPKGLREMERFVSSADGKLPTIPFSHFTFVSPPYEVLGCFHYPSSVYNFVSVGEKPTVVPITFSVNKDVTLYTHPDEIVLPYKLRKVDCVVVLRRGEGDEVTLYDPSTGDDKPLRMDWSGYWWKERKTEKWEPKVRELVTPGLKMAMEVVDLCIGMTSDGKVIHRLNPRRPYHWRLHLLGVVPDLGFPTVALLTHGDKIYGAISCQFPTIRFLVFTPTVRSFNELLTSLREEVSKLVDELDGENPFTFKLREELRKLLDRFPSSVDESRGDFLYYLFYKPTGGHWRWEDGKSYYGEGEREPVVLGIVGVSPSLVFGGVDVSCGKTLTCVGGMTPDPFLLIFDSSELIPIEFLPLLLSGENSLNFSLWGRDMYPSVIEINKSLRESDETNSFYFSERLRYLPSELKDVPVWLVNSYIGNPYELHPLKRVEENVTYTHVPYFEWKMNFKEPLRRGKEITLSVRVGDIDFVRSLNLPLKLFVNFPFDRPNFTRKMWVTFGGLFVPSVPNCILSRVISPVIIFGFPYKRTEETNFSWDFSNNMVFKGIELGCRSLLWTLRSTGNLTVLKDSDLDCLNEGIPAITFIRHPIVDRLVDVFDVGVFDPVRCFIVCRYLYSLWRSRL